jgi:cytoskeleton protein RodZ
MDDLGSQLKRARDGRGLSLSAIANRTKISVTALEALERNDLSKLPGGIFGRAFVRAYASELGLDPDKTVADFHVALEEAERRAAERGARHIEITADDRAFLERQRRAVRIFRVALGVFVIAAVVLVGWLVRGLWVSDPSASPAGASTPTTTSP